MSPSLTQSPVTVAVGSPCALHVLLISTQGFTHVNCASSKADVVNLTSFSAVQKHFSVAVSGSLAARLGLQVWGGTSTSIIPLGGNGHCPLLVQWVTPS